MIHDVSTAIVARNLIVGCLLVLCLAGCAVVFAALVAASRADDRIEEMHRKGELK